MLMTYDKSLAKEYVTQNQIITEFFVTRIFFLLYYFIFSCLLLAAEEL